MPHGLFNADPETHFEFTVTPDVLNLPTASPPNESWLVTYRFDPATATPRGVVPLPLPNPMLASGMNAASVVPPEVVYFPTTRAPLLATYKSLPETAMPS